MSEIVERLRSKGHMTQGDGLLALLDTGIAAANLIKQQAREIADLREALRLSFQGWENVLELSLLPEQHRKTARWLAKAAAKALEKSNVE